MTVYIDMGQNSFGRMKMSHMIADTPQELHAMAAAIGVRRRWFQDKSSFPHYDVCQVMKIKALKLGAVEVDRRGLHEAMKRIRAAGAWKINPGVGWE